MPNDIRSLPEEITDLIRALGARKLVLLEGPDDKLFFEEIFLHRLADIAFLGVSGRSDVYARLSDLQSQRPDVTAFGIVDRDFADEDEVQSVLDNPSANCFLLRRYSIENYALEPAALWNVLRVFLRPLPFDASPTETSEHLLELCSQLSTTMAANFVIRRSGDDLTLFHEKYNLSDRTALIQEMARRLGITDQEAEALTAAREARINAAIATSLEAAHCLINGKHLLYRVWLETKERKRGLTLEHLFSLLVEWLKQNQPPNPDLNQIVNERILKLS